jgi:DNA-binding GntR family transcriptional regulator
MPEFQQAPPKYIQIADYYRERILSGELRPGDEVPSERQVSAEWKVSRPTATKALDMLRREGYAAGRQGSGTYVTEPSRLHRQASDRYRRSAETGRIYPANERARILAAELVEAPPDVAEVLGLQPGDQVIRRERLTLRDDEPVEVSISWVDGRIARAAPRLLETERILEGSVAYVEGVTGRRARWARDRISARLATADESAVLGLDDSSAVLVTSHVVCDVDDEPLEYVSSVAVPDAWTIEHEYVAGR